MMGEQHWTHAFVMERMRTGSYEECLADRHGEEADAAVCVDRRGSYGLSLNLCLCQGLSGLLSRGRNGGRSRFDGADG